VQRYFYHTEIVRYKSSDYEQNEFMQSGIEYFNDPSPLCDAEVIAVALKFYWLSGSKAFACGIGHSDYIYALLTERNI
jgi:ATP phosphoribosyltransferase regulatory subunit HisZ